MPQPAPFTAFGRQLKIEGGIMSILPPCLDVADALGDHPYTGISLGKQLRDLKEHLNEEKKAIYGGCDNRIGDVGLHTSYAHVNEQRKALVSRGTKNTSNH